MADLALVAIMAVWDSSFAMLRAMLAGGAQSAASPLLLLAARMTLATVLLLPLIEFVAFRRKPPLPALLGVLLAFAGMATLSKPWHEQTASTLTGDALTVACAVVFAGHIIVLGRVASKHPVLPLLLLQLASMAAAALLVGLLVE